VIVDGLQRISASLAHAREMAIVAADAWKDISYVWGGFDFTSDWVGGWDE
jgi:hypothetical protein